MGISLGVVGSNNPIEISKSVSKFNTYGVSTDAVDAACSPQSYRPVSKKEKGSNPNHRFFSLLFTFSISILPRPLKRMISNEVSYQGFKRDGETTRQRDSNTSQTTRLQDCKNFGKTTRHPSGVSEMIEDHLVPRACWESNV